MQRCTRCILAEDFPKIKFDVNGVCNYCHAWDRKWKNFDYEESEKQLVELFNSAKSKKRKYDCLIPYSGGRDSSYVVYLCKNKYKLNPLVVTYNNLFMSDFAINNIHTMIQKLNVDHVYFTYKPDVIKSFYTSMVKYGGEFCSVCTSGINYVTIVYQKMYCIPLVISGTSTRVDEQSPFEVTSTHPKYLKKVLAGDNHRLDSVNELLIKRQYEESAFDKIKMKLMDTDFTRINLPDYVRWDNSEIQDVLEKELGWLTPDKQKDHIDCKYAPIKYYLKNKQIPHFIFKQEKYSQLIRDGQMSRDDALESLHRDIQKEHEEPVELEDFMHFLGLTRDDLENKEKRSHLDYIQEADLVVEEDMLFKALSMPWKLYKKIAK